MKQSREDICKLIREELRRFASIIVEYNMYTKKYDFIIVSNREHWAEDYTMIPVLNELFKDTKYKHTKIDIGITRDSEV